MRTVQDIVFGVTSQTVYFDAPEGRPSSVTSVEVFPWDSSDDDADTSAVGSGSVETGPNTTIDANSGYGQTDARKLNVTATTSAAIGRTYLVTSADGVTEWFTVAEIDSANYLIAQHPLHNAYASGDTVQSTRIQATIDSTWVADESNLIDAGPNPAYRVRWVYVVGGVTRVADTYFTLVRYAGTHGVRPQDVDGISPQWLDRLPPDHRADQGKTLLDNAYKAVRLQLHAVWTAAETVANGQIIDELTRYKAVELGEFAKVMAGADREAQYQLAKAAYQAHFDSLARLTPKIPVRDTSGAAAMVVPLGLSRR